MRQLKKLWNSGSFAWKVDHWLTTSVSAASIMPTLTKMNAGVDIYNALNTNAPLTLNNAFGRWQQPTSILLARFVKLNLQMDF